MRSRSLRFNRYMPRIVPNCGLLETEREPLKESRAICALRVWSTVS